MSVRNMVRKAQLVELADAILDPFGRRWLFGKPQGEDPFAWRHKVEVHG